MNIEERVLGLINGQPYSRKDISLTDEEEEIIIRSMNEFRDNINPKTYSGFMAFNRTNALIDKNDYKHMTTTECRTVCESLYDVLNKENCFAPAQTDFFTVVEQGKDMSKVSDLFIKMQKYAEYDFLKQVDKCSRSRKEKNEDVGEGAFELLANGYKK